VFLFEVVLVLIILSLTPRLVDAVRTGRPPRLDLVGTVLSAGGLGLVVLAVGLELLVVGQHPQAAVGPLPQHAGRCSERLRGEGCA
jgi:hypothetical protein